MPAEVFKPALTDFLLTVLELRTFPRTWLADFALPTGRLVVFLGIHPQYAAFVSGEQKGFPHYPAVSNPGQARRQTLEGIAVSQPRPTPPADPAELRLHEAVGRGFSLAAKSILAKGILEMG